MWQLHDQQVRDPANNSSINMTLTLGSIAGALFDAPQPSRVVASRVTEHVIPLNKPVYCMGEVMLDGKRLILRPSSSNEDDKPFIVRYGSQYEVAQEIKAEAESYKTWSNYMFGLSGVTGAGALALIANDVSRQTR